ncbi:MAG: holo-ACP synthase [Candidatus Omnitrophota bacterium]|nr:holo-ACP synthase [Candidatus Omnitrophota bacterium]
MIVGSGVDLVEIEDLKKTLDKQGDKLIKRIFTAKEMDYSLNKKASTEHLAVRFAAKEAVLKAFGNEKIKSVRLRDIEILNDKNGKPEVNLSNSAEKLKVDSGIDRIIISLSHTKRFAVASAILTKEREV